jgi:hypothetical protein
LGPVVYVMPDDVGGAPCCPSHLVEPRKIDFIFPGDAVASVPGTVAPAADTLPVEVGTTFVDMDPVGPARMTFIEVVLLSVHPGPTANELYDDVGGRSMVGRLVLGLMGTSPWLVPLLVWSSIHVMPALPGRFAFEGAEEK